MIKSAFQNHFAQTPNLQRPRSQFKRVSRHKHTFDEGQLIPFYVDDVLPGDTFNVKAAMFARLATPIFPIMDNMYLETFWFFCPNRLVWDNFVKQHGERIDPDDSTDFTTPVIDSTTIAANSAVGSLWDNFGLPMKTGKTFLTKINSLPFRMYNKIYNEWFRDQDLQDSLVVDMDNGPDSLADYQIKRGCKFKDYLTTARPQPQKSTAVEIPIAGTAPVLGIGKSNQTFATGPITPYESDGAQGTYAKYAQIDATNANEDFYVEEGLTGTSGTTGYPNIRASLTQAEDQATINQLREAIVLQQAYEIDMRGGTRYIEMVYNHYGVVNPDFRLQRPEFLGYQRSMVNIHPVPQTSESSGTAQGNLAAFGTVASHGNGFIKTFTEHGFVIGLVMVRSDLSYQESVERMWSRRTRFDYYYPSFANLGEQAVLKQEIQISDGGNLNEDAWGYNERWAEYRYKTSRVTGLFRSSAAGSLDAWHLSQEFSEVPSLGNTFIQEDAPVDRCIATPSEPHFIFDSLVENIAGRPMPVYSVPGLLRM